MVIDVCEILKAINPTGFFHQREHEITYSSGLTRVSELQHNLETYLKYKVIEDYVKELEANLKIKVKEL